ncbi:Small_GTPase [Hexamita inflata]|uniref:Small GTPase n=1 Tax=Hexamita inflata TaxID=28002 RepID=A0AA86RVP6_9EUKA|nr:Small GTPase [Hexamita inflata]
MQFLQCKNTRGRLQICDASELDKEVQINPAYYLNTFVVLIIFSFCDKYSFEMCKICSKCVQEYCNDAKILLIGTNFTNKLIISMNEAINFAQFNDYQLFELKNENLDDLKTVVQKMVLERVLKE